jgi:hypothetical protein
MEQLTEKRSEATMLLPEYEQLSSEMIAQSDVIKLIQTLQHVLRF